MIWNVYNMNKTKVMLFMLSFVKVLVSRHNMQDYKGARIKRTTVTAIECINGDDRYLNLMIIWLANTY